MTQRIITTLVFGVTFSFKNGSKVVVVDIKAPYKLKTLIAICPNKTMISIIKENGPNNRTISFPALAVNSGSAVVKMAPRSIIQMELTDVPA